MNYNFIVLLLFFISPKLNASNCPITLNLNDVTKADSLYNLSKEADIECAVALLDSAAYYYIRIEKFSKAHRCLVDLGLKYRSQGKPEEAISTFKKAIEYAKKSNDPDEEYRTKYLLGIMYSETSQSDSALAVLEPMKWSKPKTANKKVLGTHALVYNVLGNEYVAQRAYGKSIEHYKTGLKLCRESGYKSFEVTFLNGLGTVCSYIYDENGALAYYEEALNKMDAQNQMWGIVNNNIARIKLNQEDYNSARKYYSRVLENTYTSRVDSCAALIALGEIYLKYPKILDLNMSKKLLDHGLIIARDFKNNSQLINGNLNMGVYFSSIENYESAQEYFGIALDLTKDKKKFLNHKVEIEYEQLKSSLKEAKKDRLSAQLVSFYHNIDSVINTKILQVIEGERVKYDIEKKEQEIALLEKENELTQTEATRNKAIGAAASLLFLLISTIVFLLYYRERKNKAAAEQRKEMVEKIRIAENHVVENSYGLILGNLEEQENFTKNKETQQALRKTRSLVHASSVVYNTIKAVEDDHSKASQNFCIGFTDLCNKLKTLANQTQPTKVHIDCDESIRISKNAIRPLFLAVEELFTNSVKHAFLHVEDPVINISLKKIGDHTIQLLYSDNGPGVTKRQDISLVKPADFEILDSLISKLKGSTTIETIKGLSFKFNFDYKTLSLL